MMKHVLKYVITGGGSDTVGMMKEVPVPSSFVYSYFYVIQKLLSNIKFFMR